MIFRGARKLAGLVGVAATVSSTLLARSPDVPLRNWTVPPYTAMGAEGGLTTMADISDPVAFVPIDPCRVADTRGNGFTGQAGGPILTANMPRTFQVAGVVAGVPAQCGVPVGTKAVSFQFTVVQPLTDGNLIAWPAGGSQPNASVLNWFGGILAIGNGTIVPLGGGSVTVLANAPINAMVHLVIDVNGYFTDTYNLGDVFQVVANAPGGPGIWGINTASAAETVGVRGTTGAAGARTYGVAGVSPSNPNGSAGVKGVQGTEHVNVTTQPPAGVLGASSLFDGVLGITIQGSLGAGVRGIRLPSAASSTPVSSGELGAANFGGVFVNDVEITGDLDVGTDILTFGVGNVTIAGDLAVAGGNKMFVEPHPTDPAKAIRYVSLEGPESGTYFRGRGRFERGVARITVPEDFRFVTSAEGLTVQVTPIGGMATVGVLRMDLDEIVVQSSRNLEFSYLVQGVRKSHAKFHPIGEAGTLFVRGADSRLKESLPAEFKRRLIANGSYNEDGTVNMETARRLGWDRIWAERGEGPAPAPPSE